MMFLERITLDAEDCGFMPTSDTSLLTESNYSSISEDDSQKPNFENGSDTLAAIGGSESSDSSDSSSFTDSSYSSTPDDVNETPSLVDCSGESVVVADSSNTSASVDKYIHTEPLLNLPACFLLDGVKLECSPHIPARMAAINYCLSVGMPPDAIPRTYTRVDKDKARRIARLFDELPPSPHDELTQASYRALAAETLQQWQTVKATGLRYEYNPARTGVPDPYLNPRRLILDVRENNHIFITSTRSSYGPSFQFDPLNPLLDEVPSERISGEVPLVNDILRVVHDYFGHVREGLGFRCEGEYNAWRGHLAMFSPLARRAMSMEMLVQNCWINYGPYGDANRFANPEETRYPEQKLCLMPEWISVDGVADREECSDQC